MSTHVPPVRIRAACQEDIKLAPLFKGVSDSVVEALVPGAHICKLDRNKKLYTLRPHGNYLYIIREGYLALRVNSHVLRWDNFLAWRGPGQLLGEFALLYPEIISGNSKESDHLGLTGELKATEECELLEIEGGTFANAASRDANIYRNLSRLLIEKMTQEGKRSEVIQMSPALKRVAKTLLLLIEERGYRASERKIIRGRIVQLDLAGFIGASRGNVSKQMQALKTAGLIDYNDDGDIEILDERRLRNEVERS